MRRTKHAVVGAECVACGNCTNYCPSQAISINKGVRAQVDAKKCLGCGKCEKACPAGVAVVIENELTHA